jgi:hypothetical protein
LRFVNRLEKAECLGNVLISWRELLCFEQLYSALLEISGVTIDQAQILVKM